MSQNKIFSENYRVNCLLLIGILMLNNLACLKKVCIFYVFYCLCCVKEISMDVLEEHVSEERDPEMNE